MKLKEVFSIIGDGLKIGGMFVVIIVANVLLFWIIMIALSDFNSIIKYVLLIIELCSQIKISLIIINKLSIRIQEIFY